MQGNNDPTSDILQKALDEHIQATPHAPEVTPDPVNALLQKTMLEHGNDKIVADKKETPVDVGGAGSAFVSGVGDTLTMGAAPAIGHRIAAEIGAKMGRGDYESNLSRFQKSEEATQKAHPTAYASGRVAGDVIPAAIGAVIPLEAAAVTGKGLVNAAKGIGARDAGELKQTVQAMRGNAALKTGASGVFEEAKKMGANLTPDATQGVVSAAMKAVSDAGLVNPKLHGDTLSVMTDLVSAAKKGSMSLEELMQHRQLLEETIARNTSRIEGMNSDGQRAVAAKKALDKAIGGLVDADISSGDPKAIATFKAAQSQWAGMKNIEKIQRMAARAGGDPNKLKAGLAKLVEDDGFMKALPANVQKQLKYAATQTGGESLLKLVGSIGVDLGSATSGGARALPMMIAGAPAAIGAAATSAMGAGVGAGTAEGAIIGGTAVGVGTLAKQIQKWVGRGKLEDAVKLIENNVKLSPSQIGKLSPAAAKEYLKRMKP